MPAPGSSIVYGTFLDVANDAKPWLQIPSSDTVRDAALGLILDMACQWVQRFIGRPVAPQEYDRRFDGWSGWNGAYLELPYSPVLQVVSVTEYRGTSGPYVLPESTLTNQVDGWQCEYLTGRLIRVFPGNVQKPWFPGSKNIEVVWMAGYDPIPADIRLATLELVAHWVRNTQQQSGLRAPGLGSTSEYDPADAPDSSMWAGVPNRVTTLLRPYLQIGLG